jgi:hypothetical protein
MYSQTEKGNLFPLLNGSLKLGTSSEFGDFLGRYL